MTQTQIRYWLNQTLEEAAQNVHTGKGGPFAAIIVKENKLLALGTNQVLVDKDPTAHAEVTAIRNACQIIGHFQLKDCILFSSCEPCPMCLGAIYWARPKAVYFAATKYDAAKVGFDDGFIYDEIVKNPLQRQIPFTQIDMKNAIEPFKIWQNKIDKTHY
ncbi:MAG: nucleoside deaminase [Bernardetiaceae bacterium]|nr:nucleoside deaminase [Bernardetiaceae bacterium]